MEARCRAARIAKRHANMRAKIPESVLRRRHQSVAVDEQQETEGNAAEKQQTEVWE